jgi:hypothetical protein
MRRIISGESSSGRGRPHGEREKIRRRSPCHTDVTRAGPPASVNGGFGGDHRRRETASPAGVGRNHRGAAPLTERRPGAAAHDRGSDKNDGPGRSRQSGGGFATMTRDARDAPAAQRRAAAPKPPLFLTFDRALLGDDQIAALDAWRAGAALGRPREACLAAAIAAYREHHPGLPRTDAIAALVRLYLELDMRRRDGRF